MSKFVFYIRLEPFVKQWLENAYGYPVSFPPRSIENSIIQRFLQKQPARPNLCGDGGVAIVIPKSSYRNPAVYNYMCQQGQRALRDIINDNLNRNLWIELGDLDYSQLPVMSSICAWCDIHGVDIDYADTIRQRFYRIREIYRKNGVDMMHKTKRKYELKRVKKHKK